MIKNNITIDGEDVFTLPFNSRKQVLKICDMCGVGKPVSWDTVIRCRQKHNTEKDYCFLSIG